MIILLKKKTTTEYLEKISSEPKNTIANKTLAIENFKKFSKATVESQLKANPNSYKNSFEKLE